MFESINISMHTDRGIVSGIILCRQEIASITLTTAQITRSTNTETTIATTIVAVAVSSSADKTIGMFKNKKVRRVNTEHNT